MRALRFRTRFLFVVVVFCSSQLFLFGFPSEKIIEKLLRFAVLIETTTIKAIEISSSALFFSAKCIQGIRHDDRKFKIAYCFQFTQCM